MPMWTCRPSWLFAALSLWLCAGGLRAQDNQAQGARAEQLFVSGKQALARGELASACAQLAESFHLEAATGSLLALAVCRDRQKQLISALGAYRQVLSRSLEEARPDRARAALAKIEELEKRISTLTIYSTLAADSADLTVHVNGSALGREQLGTKLPVDGSTVLVEAFAPGKQAWRSSVSMSAEGQTLYLTIPPLVSEPSDTQLSGQPAQRAASARAAVPKPRLNKLSWTGIGLLGGSAVVLAVAGGYTYKAAKLNRDSEAGCDGNDCNAEGHAQRLDARHAGTVASATLITGAVLGVAGVTALWAGRRAQRADRRKTGSLQLSGWLSPGSAGAAVMGSY